MVERPTKRIADSRVSLSLLMGPQQVNTLGNVHGGIIMKYVDEAGALAAMRHAQSHVVTVAIDSMTFMQPIYVGNLVTFQAELTFVGRTSMETRVTVIAENPLTGERRTSNTAYVVYVALDGDGRPQAVPQLHFQTPEEIARARAAQERQDYRKQLRAKETGQ